METVTQESTAGVCGVPGSDLSGTQPFRESRGGRLVLAAVWVASTVYLATRLRYGWAGLDAGALAQMADRVLHGQVPFRDFVEEYTGGLTYLNALALRFFGVNLFSMRIPLFLFFVGWVPSVYFIARRFVRPLAAGAMTILCVAWSVPNYPEAMPSWYNLFFATWGVLALLRFIESEKKRWLWVAGFCGGLSLLFKISGLYFVAASLLFFVFRELSLAGKNSDESPSMALPYKVFVSAGLLAFLGLLFNLISWIPTAPDYVHFFLPSLCVVSLLLWMVWRGETGPSAPRFRRLFGMGLPFVVAFLTPVSLFALWFAYKHSLSAWIHGCFLTPTIRLWWVGAPPTPLAISAGLLPAVAVVLLACDRRFSSRWAVRVGIALALAALLLACAKWSSVYLLVGFSAPLLVPILAVGGSFFLRRATESHRQRVFLLLAVAVVCALVQFPMPTSIYLNYAAPLVALGVLAILSVRPGLDRFAIGSVCAFYMLFALWLRTPGYFYETRALPDRPIRYVRLAPGRAGGLFVKASEAREYDRLIKVVESHARGRYIYCTPDCPEVYFLSGKQNPTPTINEFLGQDFSDVPLSVGRVLYELGSHSVSLVVLNGYQPSQSGPPPGALRRALDARFPLHEAVGKFEVRWRSGSAGAVWPYDPRLNGPPSQTLLPKRPHARVSYQTRKTARKLRQNMLGTLRTGMSRLSPARRSR